MIGRRNGLADRAEAVLVAVVVFCGVIHLPAIGLGADGAPDPRWQLLVIVPSLVGAVVTWARRPWRLLSSPAVALVMASVGWLSISSLFGPEPIDGFARGVWFAATALTVIGGVDRLGVTTTLVAASVATTVFIGLGLGLHATGIVDGAWQIELASEPLFPWSRLNALGQNQTVIGLTGALTVLALFGTHRSFGRLGTVAVAAIGLAGVAASHNRSAIAALAVGGLAAAIWARRRWSLVAAAAAFAAIGAAALSGQIGRRLNRDSLADQEAFDFYEGAERGVFTGRPAVWADAWRLGWERPLIGRGNGSFAQYTDARFLAGSERWDPNHAHNTLLEVFVDQGVVGVVLILALAVALLRLRDRWDVTTVAVLAAIATHGIVEAMFYGSPSTRWTFLVIVVAGLCVDRSRLEDSPSSEHGSDEQTTGVDVQRSVHTSG